MQKCEACGIENPDDALRCKVCGEALGFTGAGEKTQLVTAADITFQKGDPINNQFRILRFLGRGGMGQVYLVEDEELNKTYALKLILPELVNNPEARKRFLSEVTISRELTHPNIINIFDFGKTGETTLALYYFTMEYLEGKTLGQLLRERALKNRLPRFSLAEIRQIMTTLLKALAYAHRRIVHRDIKPDNIMLPAGWPDTDRKIKILDFGIARTITSDYRARTVQGLGAAHYIAPEQKNPPYKVDLRADIYSTGILLFELLTGVNNIGFELPSSFLSQEYQPFDEVVKTAVATRLDNRYPDAPSMLAELEAALDETEQALQAIKQKKERERQERQRKEEEERKQREKRLKIAPLQANLEDAVARGKWRRASDLCAAIQAIDPTNPVVAEKLVRIEEELTRQRQKEEQQRKAAEEAAKRKREQEKKIADLRDRLTDAVIGRQWKKARSICKTIISLDSSQNEIRARLHEIEQELARQAEEEKKKKEQEEERRRQEEAQRWEKQKTEEQVQIEDILISQERADQQDSTPKAPPGRGWLVVGIAAVFFMVSGAAYFALRPGGEVQPPGAGNNQQEMKKKVESAPTYTDPTTGMEFVYVPGGCFQMGDASDGLLYKPVHEVCVDGFYMGRYEVTQGQWQKVMGSNLSYFKKGDNYPVEMVSWNDAQEFITRLNRRSNKKYRLPFEAEWEYAARSGGKKERYAGGNDVDAVAWYTDNSRGTTHLVGRKQANGLGLYDMSGNVSEWCSDWYDTDYYKSSPRHNPQGPASGSQRVIRGGGWSNISWNLQAAARSWSESADRNDGPGFRLVFSEGSR